MARDTTSRTNIPDQDKQDLSGPVGKRVISFFGPGNLRPGIGRVVQRSGRPYHCGAMICRIFGFTEAPNKRDPNKMSVAFQGQFMGVTHAGEVINSFTAYLPSPLIAPSKAALELQRGHISDPIEIQVEVWCEPSEKSPLGYNYTVYDRKPADGADPLLALAAAAGFIERPALPPPAASASIEGTDEIDPETGEIS